MRYPRSVAFGQIEALGVFEFTGYAYFQRFSGVVAFYLPVINVSLGLGGSVVRLCSLFLIFLSALAGILTWSLSNRWKARQ